MTPQIRAWVEKKVATGAIPRAGSILEVGSRNVNGGVRDLFDQASYLGVDQEQGPGVDVVTDVRFLNIHGIRFNLVICLEVLEHVPRFWEALDVMRESLGVGGLLLLSAPTTGFPEHRYPVDCYRFMPDAFRDVFFHGMNILALDTVRDDEGHPGLIGLARK